MMKLNLKNNILLYLILFSLTSYSFAQQSDLKVEINPARSTHELELVIKNIMDNIHEKAKLTGLEKNLHALNKSLHCIEDTSSLLFFKSEFYKFFINYNLLEKENSFQLSQSHILSIKNKFTKNRDLYSPLSQLIIEKALADFKPFLKGNFLNNYIALKDSKDFERRKKLKRILKYLSPWIKKIESVTVHEFNEFITYAAFQYISTATLKSTYFNYSRACENAERNIFIVSRESALKPNSQNKQAVKTEDFIKNLKPKDLKTDPSEKIDSLIEKIDK